MPDALLGSERASRASRAHAPAVLFDFEASRLSLRALAPPRPGPGEALVATRLTGIDGTDEEILDGAHGAPPRDRRWMVLGHECVGDVVEAPEGSGLSPGDLVVPLVRHGCGMCRDCRYDAPDLCPTGDFVEHGIKGIDGFARPLFAEPVAGLVRAPRALGDLAVLTEPLSITVKALEEARRLQGRLPWFEEVGGFRGCRALVAGLGSLGMLAAFLLRDEGMNVWAMDRHGDEAGPARLLRRIGGTHVNAKAEAVRDVAEDVGGFDLVVEATGAPEVVFDAGATLQENGVMCVLGVPEGERRFEVEGGGLLRRFVLKNQAWIGSVNSNRGHFEAALDRLLAFEARWPGALAQAITHRFPPERAEAAFAEDSPDLVKKVIDWRAAPD